MCVALYNESFCVVDNCASEMQQVEYQGHNYGTIKWPKARIGETVQESCPCEFSDISEKATRVCGGNFNTGARWLQSNMSSCELSDLKKQSCGLQVNLYWIVVLFHSLNCLKQYKELFYTGILEL